MAMTAEQQAAHLMLQRLESGSIGAARVLSGVQELISNIDGWLTTASAMADDVALLPPDMQLHVAGLLQCQVSQTLMSDMQTLRAAAVAYRDAHQPV